MPYSLILPMTLIHRSYVPTAQAWPILAQAVVAWRAANLSHQSAVQSPAQSVAAGDFSCLWVVVPEHAHAHALRQALRAEVPGALIPPRMFTLDTLAEDMGAAYAPPPYTDTERLLTVYGVLRENSFLQRLSGHSGGNSVGNLWALARQLLQLCDELSAYLMVQPDTCPALDDAANLDTLLFKVFGERAALLSVEARLLLSVWHALRDASNPHAVLQQRLYGVAAQATVLGCAALWLVHSESLLPWLQAWLAQLATQVSVQQWSPQLDAPDAPLALVHAWPEKFADQNAESARGLPSNLLPPQARALAWQQAQQESGAAEKTLPWRIVTCQNLEEEALTATRAILDAVTSGNHLSATQPNASPRTLAVVAQDVVVARRVQALLARAGLPVRDETGWKLSTTAAATAVMRWLDCVLLDAPWQAVLDVLKSPFLPPFLHQTASITPAQLIHVADLAWRAAQVKQGWSALYHALPEMETAARQAFIELTDQARQLNRRGSLLSHLQRLLRSLSALGMDRTLQADEAGIQLWQVLQRHAVALAVLETESTGESMRLSVPEFHAWLSQLFETQPYLPPVSAQAAPNGWQIVFVSLAGARLRAWDQVVLLGVGAQVLQASVNETLFFGEAVRHELGLPTRAQRQIQLEQYLLWLLSAQVPTVMTWRAHEADEPLPLAPALARLQLMTEFFSASFSAPSATSALTVPYRERPLTCSAEPLSDAPFVTPRIPPLPALLPSSLSASGWEKLVSCPYRYWAMSAWRLGERDEMQDNASKRDYGQLVHAILYEAHSTVLDSDPAKLRDCLPRIAATHFNALGEQYPNAFVWQQRFLSWLPHYFAWWETEYAAGWRWQDGEREIKRNLPLPNGESLVLRGRLDRVDVQPTTRSLRVLDYKTASTSSLSVKVKRVGEDVQLLFYGLLQASAGDEPHLNAAYLPADKVDKKITLYHYTEDSQTFAELVAAEAERIQTVWPLLQQGAALPAQGAPAVCQYCEVRGLCRRDMWDKGWDKASDEKAAHADERKAAE